MRVAGEGMAVLLMTMALAACGGRDTPLAEAARAGDLLAMRALIQAGADVNQADAGGNGWTPLMHAIHKDQRAAVQLLLAGGADPNARSRGSGTPLVMAAGYGQTDTVRELLARGADPRAEDGTGVTALWSAAGGGAIADITDGPSLGTCFPDTIAVLRRAAPDVRLGRGVQARILRWLARGDCARLVAGLQGP